MMRKSVISISSVEEATLPKKPKCSATNKSLWMCLYRKRLDFCPYGLTSAGLFGPQWQRNGMPYL